MKILFITPINRSYVSMPPFGVGYLATIARDKGHDVDIFDSRRGDVTFDDFNKKILDGNFDIIGISMTTFDCTSAKKHIELIKKYSPKSIVILGGAHPSGDYQNVLNDFKESNYAFRGEAELGHPRPGKRGQTDKT